MTRFRCQLCGKLMSLEPWCGGFVWTCHSRKCQPVTTTDGSLTRKELFPSSRTRKVKPITHFHVGATP